MIPHPREETADVSSNDRDTAIPPDWVRKGRHDMLRDECLNQEIFDLNGEAKTIRKKHSSAFTMR
jgi:hypothetical protein